MDAVRASAIGGRVGSKVPTMGCRQGSVVGSVLWNLLLDNLFRLPIPDKCKLIAYADDVTAVIEGNCRAEIERRGGALLEAMAAWSVEIGWHSPLKSQEQ
ncbi:Putative 115 kDa protein in type-1 retrotransposable element R1DM [Eumeta japonica]|uniref:115 kDa protein in type-1 retrotransposable element R1DM n=1 Tax=Eumeta variegata TaxID=151549 RepID=A0A4C1V833_EUMVA|nr:Putative 115 kDa protein in type-1 retrotransposable element R1DM [Eumeta japonica]